MRSSLFSGSITRRKVCHGAQYVICVGICQHNTLLTRNTSRPTRRATVWKSAPSSKATQMDGRTEKEETDLSVFEAHELTPRCTSANLYERLGFTTSGHVAAVRVGWVGLHPQMG